jgi:hypothetical protein
MPRKPRRFQPIEDIPDIESLEIDAPELDTQMRKVLGSIRYALRNSILKRETKSFFVDLLKVFSTSHTIIREIIALSIKHDYRPFIADALSLTREQVEKLYVAALFLEDEDKWFIQYSRNSWRKKYEEYLLELELNEGNERLEDYLTVHYPKVLELTRYLYFPGRKPKLIVSVKAMKMVKYNYDFPRIPKKDKQTGKTNWPKYFDDKKLEKYFKFPTPGASLGYFRDPKTKELLTRWHKDYQYLCNYTHIGFGKLLIQAFSNNKSMRGGEVLEWHSEIEQGYSIFISHTAIACVCTMLVPFLKEDYGAVDHLKDFWKIISNSSLLSKGYWNLYARDVLN